MASWFRDRLSLGSSKDINVLNSKEVSCQINLSNWKIPRQKVETIYQIGTFDFSAALSIQDHEETFSLDEEFQSIKLLSRVAIKKYKEKYRYIHFGMIQVALRPLTRLGLDCPIFMALRDNRLLRYKDSLLAMIQTNICNGPIYFNCCPNYSVDLNDPWITDTLVLDIHLPTIQDNSKVQFRELSRNFAITYRIYFKLLSSHLNPKCILKPTLNETILLKAESDNITTFTPKLLKWNEITIPQEFIIQNTMPPRNIAQKNIQQIIEEPNGRILIRFNSIKETSSSSNHSQKLESSRASYSIPSSSSNYDSFKDTPMNDTHKIYYKAPIAEPVDEATSSIGSPTYSTMQVPSFSSINVITRPFEINKEYLRTNFNSIENKSKREWFLSHFDLKAQAFIRQEWYSFMERHQINIPFFKWWSYFALDNNLPDLFKVEEINTNSNFAKKWTLLNGQIITSFIPPLEAIVISTPQTNIPATPFKIGRNDPDDSQIVLKDIKKVYHQNNYTNQVLHTVSQQINMVSTQIEAIKKQEIESLTEKLENLDISDNNKTKTNFLNDIAKPLFKITRSNKLELPQANTPLIQKINEKLKEVETSSPHTVNILEKDSSSIDYNLQNIYRIARKEIPYYSRQTPPDLHLEGAKQLITENFAGDSIYEWNIDGRSDHEIFVTLQRMIIAYTAYSTKQSTDLQAFDLLTAGFTGILKNWWENYIQEEERQIIRTHTNAQGQPDNIETLIYTIVTNFLGSPKDITAANDILLTNLRCPTLEDYNWYKDTFLTYLLKREDCRQPYWKEKFVSGLPSLFSQRIFNKLREVIGRDPIPFEQITFGQLLSFIKKEGISLCSELKLQARYSSDKAAKRKELGSFCEAFFLPKLEAPSVKRKRKTQNSKGKDYNIQPSNYKHIGPNKTMTKRKNFTKLTTCFKCGKIGHYARNCKVKKQLTEICADYPDLQHKLIQLLDLKDTPSQSEDSSFENENNNINEDVSASSDYSSTNESSRVCYKCINVITTENNDAEFLLDLIDQIPDIALRKKYFQRLRNILVEKDSFKPPPKVNIHKIFETREIPNILKVVNIQDLKMEINNLKDQIQMMQTALCSLQTKDLELETRLTLIENQPSTSSPPTNAIPTDQQFVSIINKINFQKWHIRITLKISDNFALTTTALLDSGADQNCIKEGLIPYKYYERTTERLQNANGTALHAQFQLSNAYICNNGYCFKNSFIVVRVINQEIVLGTPFLTQIYPFKVDQFGIHTKVMETPLTFEFIAPISNKIVRSFKIFQ